MLRKLAAVMLVVGLVAISALAQGTTGNVRDNRDANRNVSASLSYSEVEIQAERHDQTLMGVSLVDEQDAEPLNLTRSFKDALRENIDKETMTRQSK